MSSNNDHISKKECFFAVKTLRFFLFFPGNEPSLLHGTSRFLDPMYLRLPNISRVVPGKQPGTWRKQLGVEAFTFQTNNTKKKKIEFEVA